MPWSKNLMSDSLLQQHCPIMISSRMADSRTAAIIQAFFLHFFVFSPSFSNKFRSSLTVLESCCLHHLEFHGICHCTCKPGKWWLCVLHQCKLRQLLVEQHWLQKRQLLLKNHHMAIGMHLQPFQEWFWLLDLQRPKNNMFKFCSSSVASTSYVP